MKRTLTLKLTVTLVILITLGISSCKKKSDPAPTPTPTNKVTSKFYFKATLDGTAVSFQDGVNGYGSASADESGTTSTGSWQEVQGAILTKPFATTNMGGFYVMKDDPSYSTTYTEPAGPFIEAMFSVKSYPFGVDQNTTDPGVDGVVVFYVDNSGVEWRSDLGSGDQTGSTFSIIEHIANTDGYSHRISKASFTCKLYNSSGSSKTLTNGLCRSRSVLY